MSRPVKPVITSGPVAFVGNRPGEKEVAAGIAHHARTQEICLKSGTQVGLPGPYSHHLAYNLYKKTQPTNNQVDAQRDRLLDELREYKPRVIFALGSAPYYALTGDAKAKVTKIQGKPVVSDLIEWEHTILVIPHPATLVYRPQDYREYMHILSYAADLLNGGEEKEPPPSRYTEATSRAHLVKLIEKLKDPSILYISADIETGGLSFIDDRILCLGLNFDDGYTVVINETLMRDNKDLITEILNMEGKQYIWHNGKFDINFLREYGVGGRVDHDTMLLEYLLDETSKSLSLKKLAQRYLGAEAYNEKIMGIVRDDELEQGFAGVPTDVLYEYLGQDCLYTRKLFELIYKGVADDPGLLKAYRMLMLPATELLSDVERNGLLVSRERLEVAKEEMSERLNVLRKEIVDIGSPYWNAAAYQKDTGAKKLPDKFNPGSTKQLHWIIYSRMRPEIPPRTIEKENTSADTIEALFPYLEKKVPGFARALLEFRKVRKIYSTYVIGSEKKLRSDGRANGSYKISGTATGRLSVDLFQQIPPVARKFYVAPKGRILVEVDYSGAELRVLAALSGDPEMKKIFREGRDLHSEVASSMYDIPLGTETREQRLVAKTVNFGIMYGRQAPSIAREFGFSISEATSYINAWFARFPLAHAFLKEARASVTNPGYLISPYGRKRRFPIVSTANKDGFENEACNFRMQSTASDCTMRSAIILNKGLREVYDAKILNLVHDSILFEFPDDTDSVREGMKVIESVMKSVPREELQTDVTFEVEFAAGYSWGEVTEERANEIYASS